MSLSGTDLLAAYGGIRPDQAGAGIGLAFVPSLIGLIKPIPNPGGAPQGVLFSRREFCNFWIPIPGNLIESVDLLGKEECKGHTYDYVRLTLKLPSAPEGQLYAGLMLQAQRAQEAGAAGTRRNCTACRNIFPKYGLLKDGLRKARDQGYFSTEGGCETFVDDTANAGQILAALLGEAPSILIEAVRSCGKCGCEDIF
jgi:hypothetical protein